MTIWRSGPSSFKDPVFIDRKCPNKEKRKKLQKILKEGRKVRRSKIAAQSGDRGRRGKESDFDAQADVGGIDDNADYICWFCHVDVSLLGNNKCAGCRKVTHISKQILMFAYKTCFRRGTVVKSAKERTGDVTEIFVFWCKRRSGRRWRLRLKSLK